MTKNPRYTLTTRHGAQGKPIAYDVIDTNHDKIIATFPVATYPNTNDAHLAALHLAAAWSHCWEVARPAA